MIESIVTHARQPSGQSHCQVAPGQWRTSRMFLALHGQTEWNRDGRVQGQLDSPLTEHGRRQAVTAARILGGQNLVSGTFEIVCSPLGRTRETARIIAAELGFDVSAIRSDERLREVSLGQWDGHTRAEIEARWP